MSAIHSESFFAFGEYNGSDDFTDEVNEVRVNYAAALQRAGYVTHIPANDAAATTGGFTVRTDPLYPGERRVLAHSSAVPNDVSAGVTAAFKKKLPLSDMPFIIGFSVYIPSTYKANNVASTVPVLRVNAGLNSDASWWEEGIVVASAKEVFRVTNDLSVRWGTDAPQTSKKLKVGNLNYLEFRINATEVQVWLDDTFLMSKAVSLIPDAVAFIFENNINTNPLGTNLSGAPGRWALGNMYYLLVDGVAPQVRLGPTTRIIGQRPDTDVDVRFLRPAAAPSNAAVAGQDITDSPPWQLQSTTVGDFDTYSAEDETTGDAIRTMAQVHAVTVKVLASNLEPDLHKVRPYAKYEGSAEGAMDRPKELVLLNSPTVKNIKAMALRPGGGGRVVIAGDGEMLWQSGYNYDVSTWTKISESGGGQNFQAMWARADGALILGSWSGVSVGRLSHVAAGTDVWTLGTANGSTGGFGDFALTADSAILRAFVGRLTTAAAGFNYNATAAVYNSASPSTGTWNSAGVTGVTPTLNTGVAHVGQKPDLSQTIMLQGSACDFVYTFNQAALTSATPRAHGDTGIFYPAITWDGQAWLIGAYSNDASLNGGPRIRRSLDGNSWSLVTAVGNNNAGVNQQLNFGKSNTANRETIFGGNAGALVMTTDGINWRQMPRLTNQNLNAAVVLPNGDFVIGGDGGVLLHLRSSGKDTELVPLAGYTLAFGAAVLNPATGSGWTAAEAAEAQFGVRLSS